VWQTDRRTGQKQYVSPRRGRHNYKKQKAITLNLRSGWLWFLCSTFPLIRVYPTITFHADIFYSHWDKFHTKLKNEKWQRAITLKFGSGWLWFLYIVLLLNEIYTFPKFHLQICNSLWDKTPTSLWRTDGRTAGRTTPNLHPSAIGGYKKVHCTLRFKHRQFRHCRC